MHLVAGPLLMCPPSSTAGYGSQADRERVALGAAHGLTTALPCIVPFPSAKYCAWSALAGSERERLVRVREARRLPQILGRLAKRW